MNTLTFGAHVAHIAPLTGVGLLVRPRPGDDVELPGSPVSLHEADWDAALSQLDALGYELTEDDDGEPFREGRTADGREVLALFGRETIDVYSLESSARALAELRELAGIVSG